MWKPIVQFLGALCKVWWALMSTAAFTALSVWSALSRHGGEVTVIGTAVLAIFFFLIAAYIAWRHENRKYLTEVEKNVSPEFSLDLAQVSTLYNAQTDTTVVCASGVLTNSGAASPAMRWRARFSSPRIDVTIGFSNLPSAEYEWHMSSGNILVLRRENMLPAKGLNAIERGHTIHGRILFEFHGDIRPDLGNFVGKLWIGCEDFKGRLCQDLFQGYEIPKIDFFPDEETRSLQLELTAADARQLVPPNPQ